MNFSRRLATTRTPGNSQLYPFPFSLFYPSEGNFIGFVGNTSSRTLVRRAIRVFREDRAFRAKASLLPGG